MTFDADLLTKLAKMVEPKRPEGFGITVHEFAMEQGISQAYAQRLLKKSGLVVTRMRIGRGVGDVYHEKKAAAHRE